MLHLQFSQGYDEFQPDDEVVVDPDNPGSFLLLRRVTASSGRILGAMNAGAAEMLGSKVSTAAVRTLFNLPSRASRQRRRLRLLL